jgi:hypothetical protein
MHVHFNEVTQHQVAGVEIVSRKGWNAGLSGKNCMKAAGSSARSNSSESPGATGRPGL